MFERAMCSVSVTVIMSKAFKRVTAKLTMLLGMCGLKYWQHKTEFDLSNGEVFTANFRSVWRIKSSLAKCVYHPSPLIIEGLSRKETKKRAPPAGAPGGFFGYLWRGREGRMRW